MSGQPDNWRREFAGGFLVSQILEIYFLEQYSQKVFTLDLVRSTSETIGGSYSNIF